MDRVHQQSATKGVKCDRTAVATAPGRCTLRGMGRGVRTCGQWNWIPKNYTLTSNQRDFKPIHLGLDLLVTVPHSLRHIHVTLQQKAYSQWLSVLGNKSALSWRYLGWTSSSVCLAVSPVQVVKRLSLGCCRRPSNHRKIVAGPPRRAAIPTTSASLFTTIRKGKTYLYVHCRDEHTRTCEKTTAVQRHITLVDKLQSLFTVPVQEIL